jgi:hypothetical protein
MFKRAGMVAHEYVRRPSITPDADALIALDEMVEKMDLRLNHENTG